MKRSCGCSLSNPFLLAAVAVLGGASVAVDLMGDPKNGPSGPAATSQTESQPMAEPADPAIVDALSVPTGFAPTEFFDAQNPPESLQRATFGGGCFWGVEATFRKVEGVTHSAVGFCGGEKDDPSYHEVCNEDTGHAEVVVLFFDPGRVSFEELVDVFWKVHDPTQVNRQGPDIGSQYRSAIFAHSQDQFAQALASREALQRTRDYAKRRIATQIESAGPFFPAEDYHQQYLAKRGLDNCHVPN